MSRIAFTGNALGTGTVTMAAPNTNSDRTVTLPDTTGTLYISGGDIGTPSAGNGSNLTNLNASNLSTGTVATARLASGSATSSTYLRGDQTWATVTSLPGMQGQVFTSSGTFTVPSGITAVKVTVVGGGGGGGASSGGCSSGAGGGGGGAGTSIRYVTGLTPGGTVSVTVGAAGTAGAGAGGAGGASSFGAFATGNGGSGGGTGFAGGTGAAGANGTASGGDINLTGYRPSINSRAGGQAYFLSQAADGVAGIAQAGVAGGGYGSGGTGSSSNAGTFNGGAGAPGIVVVEW